VDDQCDLVANVIDLDLNVLVGENTDGVPAVIHLIVAFSTGDALANFLFDFSAKDHRTSSCKNFDNGLAVHGVVGRVYQPPQPRYGRIPMNSSVLSSREFG
jgi:hypothetical protein